MINTTQSVDIQATTTFSALDFYLSLIEIPPLATNFFRWGYLALLIIGFIGNICSFLTFSRTTLRNISTGCLFMLLAVSDSIYLLVVLLSFIQFGLQISFYRRIDYDMFCRILVFVIFVTQLYSPWLLVLITSDRWARTRFPFKSKVLCTPRNALIVAAIFFILNMALNSHVLTPFFGMLLPGIPHVSCGANGINLTYSKFFYLQWTIIQVITTSLGPTGLMIIMIIDMVIRIRSQKRVIAPQSAVIDQAAVGNKHAHYQMILLLLSSVGLFLITTLPLTIDHLVASYTTTTISDLQNFLVRMTILNWLQSLNYAMNFYLHCLSSNLFRKEFLQLVRIRRVQTQTNVITVKSVKPTVTIIQEQRK